MATFPYVPLGSVVMKGPVLLSDAVCPACCLTEDVLTKDAGECAICLEELVQGDTIARLPCLCIYHKGYEALCRKMLHRFISFHLSIHTSKMSLSVIPPVLK